MSQGDAGLRLTVLGASGTYPSPGRACSGYLVSTARTHVWIDCGSGTLANLQRHIDLSDLDGVVITHEHPDHWVDLAITVNALRYGVDRPADEIPLFWTAGTERMFAALSGRSISPTFAATTIDTDLDQVAIGDIAVSFSRTDHPVETYAVRVDHAGRSLVYSADTGADWDMSTLAVDGTIDTALVEATLDDDDTGGFQHLKAAEAAAMAASAGAQRLILTHLAPGVDPGDRVRSAARHFSGPIELAEENVTYTV